MNYLIGGSINSGKIEVVNGLLEKGEIDEQNVIHGDVLRRELYDSLNNEEKQQKFPKMHRIFSGEIKGIELIDELGIDEYLRLEKEESQYVFDKKIKPIIDSMDETSNIVVVGVQLLPELVEKHIKGKKAISSMYLVRDNVTEIIAREKVYAEESEGQRNYINTLSANKTKNGEAENQYLLHAIAKAEYGKMVTEQLSELGIDTTVINTAKDFNQKINHVIDLVA